MGHDTRRGDEADDDPHAITPFNLLVLKALTRLTFQPEIDEESIELLRDMELEYDSLLKKYAILAERVNVDDKTSLLKYNEEFLVNIVKLASRYWQSSKNAHGLAISYMRLDLDDFSKVNNRHGHDIGDVVLVKVAEALKRATRPTDYVFRFGGEEFDIVLPATPLAGAQICGTKILEAIRAIRVPLPDGSQLGITGSLGASAFEHDFSDGVMLRGENVSAEYRRAQKEADSACYAAKHAGKNRLCLYDPHVNYDALMREYSSRH